MRSHNDSIDTTHTLPPLSFYNTFKYIIKLLGFFIMVVTVSPDMLFRGLFIASMQSEIFIWKP
jgi:hypothetical protein